MRETHNSPPERRVTIETYYNDDNDTASLVLEKASTRFDGERADGVVITLIDEGKGDSSDVVLDKKSVEELIMDLSYMIGKKPLY